MRKEARDIHGGPQHDTIGGRIRSRARASIVRERLRRNRGCKCDYHARQYCPIQHRKPPLISNLNVSAEEAGRRA